MSLRIIKGNILDVNEIDGVPVVAKCVTTNAIVKNNGRAVMGAGVAKVFRDAFKDIDLDLGNSLNSIGNIVSVLRNHDGVDLISFPTKVHWYDKSIIDLIVGSAEQLSRLATTSYLNGIVLLPVPGCTNGGLVWEDVRKVLEPILPDNVVLISYGD